jgi:hypothetical protein
VKLRFFAGCCILLAYIMPSTVGAQTVRRVDDVKFVGQVLSLDGPAADPRGVALQISNKVLSIRIAPETTLMPNSAEAEVAGLMDGDFASVLAYRSGKSWIADKIVFDVVPLGSANTVTLRATITRVVPDGVHIVLRLDTGGARRLAITPRTEFRVNGTATTSPPHPTKGEQAIITMRATPRGWVALIIDLLDTVPARNTKLTSRSGQVGAVV